MPTLADRELPLFLPRLPIGSFSWDSQRKTNKMISYYLFSKSVETYFKQYSSNSVRGKTNTQKSESLTDNLPHVQPRRYINTERSTLNILKQSTFVQKVYRCPWQGPQVIPTGLHHLGSDFNSSANNPFALGSCPTLLARKGLSNVLQPRPVFQTGYVYLCLRYR